LAVVPTTVAFSTIRAATVFAAGQGAAAGVISARAAALAKGVLHTMLVNNLKTATAVLVGVLACVGGSTVALLPAAAGRQEAPSDRPKAADDKKADKDKKDAERIKLQGKWVLESCEKGGQKVDIDEALAKELLRTFGFWKKLAFDGDKVTPQEGEPVPYTLAPAKKPKEIDLQIGGDVGTIKAIYDFEDGKLKLAAKANKGERPSDFDDGKNNGYLLVFEKKE
jgi:uncharacterized protein (TIGR03067 family)